MAVISKEDLLTGIKAIIGESTDDSTISLLENVADTVNDYESRIASSGDWQRRFEENDNEWRKKYRDRFFSGAEENIPGRETEQETEIEVKGYKDLFKEV